MVITLYNLKTLLSLLLISHPTISEFYQPVNWILFWFVIPLNCFVGHTQVKTIIIAIIKITVLVSDSTICLGYFMHMSHGINKKAPPTVSPNHHPPHLTRFLPGLFIVLQKILYQTSFALIRVLQKIFIFKVKQFFLSTCCWLVLILLLCIYLFLRTLFHFCPSWNSI